MATKSMTTVSIVKVRVPEAVNPIKQFVANVLGLAPSLNAFWDVIDIFPKDVNATPQLALAHYNDSYDSYNRMHESLRRVRGIIVDLNTGAVVCDSYGHTQGIPCHEPIYEEISPSNPEGVIQVPTEITMYINTVDVAPEETAKIKIGVRAFDKATTKLFMGYEGAMIRIFKWNGKVFFSTHRRIDASESNWGGRRPFFELYKELNGPQPDRFFGEELYSPYCYMLLIAHNEIRLATSTRDNRIMYIGMKKVWDVGVYAAEGGPYAWTGEFSVNVPTGGEKSSAFSNDNNHSLIIQPSIDVATANKFLFPNDFAKDIPNNDYQAKEHEIIVEYGIGSNAVNEVYFKRNGPIANEKLAGGDFVIVYSQSSEGQTIVYRLESPAFEYRVDVTGNNPNLYNEFVVNMVSFTKGDPRELREMYPCYVTENGKEMSLDTSQDRQRYWWSLFYDAVAPAYKNEVDGFYKRYVKDVNSVANFILTEYPKLLPKLNEAKSEERKRVNPKTQERFENLRSIGTNNRVSGQSSFQIVRNLLYQETGPSFYRMITTLRNLEKLKQAQAQAQVQVQVQVQGKK